MAITNKHTSLYLDDSYFLVVQLLWSVVDNNILQGQLISVSSHAILSFVSKPQVRLWSSSASATKEEN